MIAHLKRMFPAGWWTLCFLCPVHYVVIGNWHAAIWSFTAACGFQAIAEAERNAKK